MPVNAPVVVGLGEILWDLFPGGKELGGAPANVAYHAVKLGADACAVSAVGADALGVEVHARLDAVGLDRRHVVVDPERPTGTVSVTLTDGQPAYVIHTGVAWDHIPVSPALLDLARGADAVCFGTLAQRSPVSRATILEFLRAAPADCHKMLDINLRQHYYGREIVEDSLRAADMLKLNDAELPIVAGLLEIDAEGEDALEALAETYGLRLIALTCGADGSCLYTPGAVSRHPGYATNLIDAVGAGDAFTAALILGYLQGHGLDAINDDANRLAAFVCSKKGAMPEYAYGDVRLVSAR